MINLLNLRAVIEYLRAARKVGCFEGIRNAVVGVSDKLDSRAADLFEVK